LGSTWKADPNSFISVLAIIGVIITAIRRPRSIFMTNYSIIVFLSYSVALSQNKPFMRIIELP